MSVVPQEGRRGLLGHRRTVVAGLTWHARLGVDAATAGEAPVVLVHGLGVSNRYLLPTAERLAPYHPTYVPDLPGFGESERPRRPLGVAGLAEALVGWLDAQGLPRVVLLANSLGCQVVVELAVRHPGRVSRLVLVGPTGDPAARSLVRYAWRLGLDVPREPIRLVLTEILDYVRAGPRLLLGTARSMVRDPFAAKLPLVRRPTLVIRGEHDPIAPQRWAEWVARALPDGRLVVVTGAAHAVNYGAPSALVAATRDFLAEATADDTASG